MNATFHSYGTLAWVLSINLFFVVASFAQQPIAKCSFDTHAHNFGTGDGVCKVNPLASFKDGSVLISKLDKASDVKGDGNNGFPINCTAPELRFHRFAVVLRFRAESFADQTLVVGGDRFQWFALSRSTSGRLVLSLNGGELVYTIPRALLETNQWYSIGCSIDIAQHQAIVTLNGEQEVKIQLPEDFTIGIPSALQDKDALSKEKSFGFFTDGFQGRVDDITIFDHPLSSQELSALTSMTLN